MLEDGAPSSGESPAAICVDSTTAEAGVRCVNEDGTGCVALCPDGARTKYSHSEAVEMCAAQGKRLPTSAELQSKKDNGRSVCQGTGCSYDHMLVFTSDEKCDDFKSGTNSELKLNAKITL